MKFPAAARPAQLITLTARSAGAMGDLWMFAVSAATPEGIVAEGQVVLSEIVGDRAGQPARARGD
jgi:ribosomal protein L14